MLKKYESCIGITLFKFRKICIEIWYFPSHYEITPHKHPRENIEVLYIFGSAVFYRISPETNEKQSAKMNFIPRFLTVPAGWIHGFRVSKFPLIAINFAKFIDGDATSASEDIILT